MTPRFDSQELLEHAAWVRRLARGLVRDASAADDLAQEAWVAALHGAPSEPNSLRNWLAGVLARIASKERLSSARRSQREQSVARSERNRDESAVVERAQMHEVLVRAVLTLDEPYRSALLLRYFDELSPAQIAQRTKVPVATVKTQLARGLERLREKLDREHPRGRREWLAALVPLLPRRSPWIGVAFVNTKLVVAALLVCIFGLVAYLWRTADVSPDAHSASVERAVDSLHLTDSTATDSQRSPREAPSSSDSQTANTATIVTRDPDRVLRGRVVSAASQPIAGATVDVWTEARRWMGQSRPTALDEAPLMTLTTDADGRFDTELLRGHAYELCARARGFSPSGAVLCSPGGEVELVLHRSARLHGRVTFENGTPAPAKLDIQPLLTSVASRWLPTISTDEDGSYELLDAPVGAWICQVRPRAGLPVSRDLIVSEGEDVTFDVQVTRGGRAIGVVTDAETGEPVEGALVTADRFDETAVRTDAEGRYELPGVTALSPRWCYIHVRSPGYAEGLGSTRSLTGDVLNVDIALHRGRVARGSIVDTHGEPLGGALIAASARMETNIDVGSTLSRDDGTFELAGLTPFATHTLRISKPGFGTKFYDLTPAANVADEVDLGRITLAPAALVCGKLVTSSGAPLSGWFASAVGANDDQARLSGEARENWDWESPIGITRADGTFTVGDLAQGEYEFWISRKGAAASYHEMLNLGEGERRDLGEVALDIGAVIEGDVVDAFGAPLFDCVVGARLESSPQREVTYAFTDIAGHFELSGLEESSYVLTLSEGFFGADKSRVPPQSFHDIRGGTKGLRLTVLAADKLRGVVLDDLGAPVYNAYVAAFEGGTDLGGWPATATQTDEQGRFELTLIAGAKYTLHSGAGRSDATGEWRVANIQIEDVRASPAPLEVRLPPMR